MNKNLNEDKEFLVALGKHLIMQIKYNLNQIEHPQNLSAEDKIISTFYYMKRQKLEDFYNVIKYIIDNDLNDKQKLSQNKEFLNLLRTADEHIITDFIVKFIYKDRVDNDDGMWKDRIYSFVHAAILYLCYRRDRNEQTISIERLLKTLSFEQLFNILKNEKETMHQYVYESIKGYLNMLPGFDKNKELNEQPEDVFNIHGYLYISVAKCFA